MFSKVSLSHSIWKILVVLHKCIVVDFKMLCEFGVHSLDKLFRWIDNVRDLSFLDHTFIIYTAVFDISIC